MKVVCIIQARTGSTRLPEKVLREICGKTVLEHDINRLRKIKNIDEIVIATTDKEDDNKIVDEALRLGVKYFRGSEEDVLSRYYYAAKEYNANVVVRVTSDCPLLDPDVTQGTIQYYLDNKDKCDYVSNTLERTFPRGLDTEVFSFAVLEQAFEKAICGRDREHVTSYIYTNSDKFSLGCYKSKVDYSKYRLTLDTEEDFKLISAIYKDLYKEEKLFTLEDIIKLFERNKDLIDINKDIMQKEI